MKKLRVAVVFGGRSAEHEISLLSAQNVVSALDPERYEAILIGIDRVGRWYLNAGSGNSAAPAVTGREADTIRLASGSPEIALVSGGPSSALVTRDGGALGTVDVLFPVLHGPYGEDGTIQGLAKLADIPCVGAGVLGSAVGMDKDVMKRLLRDAGIPISDFETIHRYDWDAERVTGETVIQRLGLPVFVKPANLGSSIGISRASNREELLNAIRIAFDYDMKIIVEMAVAGREIECSILGNDDPVASVPGEVVTAGGFYSYAAKYLDENGTELLIPADLTDAERETIQQTCIRTFRALCCSGMARVDGFLVADGSFVVNEINTIPGFTRISMYPKLFEASGITQRELIDRLISLAVERHESERKLSLSPSPGSQPG